MRSLFVTGGSGFVGRRLLAHLPPGRYARVTALSRSARAPVAGVTWVLGGIGDVSAYEHHLAPDTDVAHLGAATGSAAADVQHAVNAAGTAALVSACERRNAGGLLYVSSIAARFPEDPRYPYATAKRAAEVAVLGAKVPFVIVRPTIVLGPGSPILDKLRILAGGPVIAAIGGGKARVQPIHVDDLATGLVLLLERRAFDGATLELGGPEVLRMAELLAQVRGGLGRPSASIMAVPYAPLRAGLVAAQVLLGSRSPLTPGQLTSFVQDGVAEPNALWQELKPRLRWVKQMVANA